MEYLNRVELAGRVGPIKIISVGDAKLARVGLATCEAFRNGGDMREEVTWHNISVWSSTYEKVDTIRKGDYLHIIARIRWEQFTGEDGHIMTVNNLVVCRVVKHEGGAQ